MAGNALFDSLVSLGKTFLPLIVPGAAGMVAAGEKLIETIDHAKDTISADTPPELEQVRKDLDARIAQISASVDDTVDKLRG